MPTKTDRILSYLPHTFQTLPRPPVLYAVADAFGNELLLGENSLAALMLAHWVDFADKNATQIDDLARLASLYGLAPRRDDDDEVLEDIEEFREHLKHYVRTFLEGTATVQGILRISAEALAIHIADENEQLDRWWTRQSDGLVAVEPRGDDAAVGLLRFDRQRASGTPARPAQVTGSVDLSAGVNLQNVATLRLKIDGGPLLEIDFGPEPKLTLAEIVKIINTPPRPPIAKHDGSYLTLASPHSGTDSSLEIRSGRNDAAPGLLGLEPRSYHGAAATGARFTGTVDLSHGVDLSKERFLRLEVDEKLLAEIDCAGINPAHTSTEEIRNAINNAFPGLSLASDDGQHLILESKTKGFESSISLLPAAAQSAANAIFGVATTFVVGREAQPARVVSTRDLRGGIDLSARSNLLLQIDGGSPVLINCAGVDPTRTQRVEIAAAINSALQAEVATITERAISLASRTLGPASEIVFETAADGDAANDIFGIASLSFAGNGATRARLAATPVLAHGGGVDVRAQNMLGLAVDGGAPIEINLHRAATSAAELASLSLDKVADEINRVLARPGVAFSDGERLLLASPTEGGASSLEITPLEIVRRRRFVTRAVVTDEAAAAVFGFIAKEAKGESAKKARLVGVPDLSQSADLQQQRFLRLRIDGSSTVEIDCAGPRPRATTLDEIVANINKELKTAGLTKDVAAHDGKHLVLISPTSGADSRIAIEPPRAALNTLLAVEPGTIRGQDATQVSFTGTADLSAGIDLDPQAAIKIGFDGAPGQEISLAGPAPNHHSPALIANLINIALQGAFARSDGRHITLISAKQGTDSSIVFEVPAGHDVTKDVFGIVAPRSYNGDAGKPARIVGAAKLTGPQDLSARRFLRLSVDGAPAQDIDCAAKADKPEAATLAEIVESIGPTLAAASPDGKHLVLTSWTVGSSSQLTLEPYAAGDALQRLFGAVAAITSGAPAAAASITGEAVLLAPANLSSRSLLRLSVDGSRPVDVDVVGGVPAKTSLDEIVTKINRVFPNLAAVTDDDHLQLTSPTMGEASSLSLQPLRYLEVMEYSEQPDLTLTRSVRHNDDWSVQNDGVAESEASIKITTLQGTVGPTLVNSSLGWMVRLFAVVEVGETVTLRRDARLGLRAEIISRDGMRRPVPEARILVGPLGAQAWVPFKETWTLTGGQLSSALQLNNPLAPAIVILRAQQSTVEISVSVIESDLTKLDPVQTEANGSAARLIGRVHADTGEFSLVDAGGNSIARLRSGPDAELSAHDGHVVVVKGPLHEDVPPLMIVRSVTRLFDVTLHTAADGGPPGERYPQVTIGVGETEEHSLVKQINGGSLHVPGSTLVRAEELDKGTVLNLPPGVTIFRYLDCLGSRFNVARFDRARFPDGVCGERGIFDVSRFTHVPPELVKAVFASDDPLSDPPVRIEFRWRILQPGTFTVNLPVDLPARFGARFNQARFSHTKDAPDANFNQTQAPELYDGAVIEPETDDKFLVRFIGSQSNFVNASPVATVDLGWTAVKLPFRRPQSLTLGRLGQAARLYLEGAGLDGFIKLEAKEPGAWGNQIAVAARAVGPAIYDVSVTYRASRFESARAAVLGQPAAELTQGLLKPGPVGVLQAKAAGCQAKVTRDRAEYEELTTTT